MDSTTFFPIGLYGMWPDTERDAVRNGDTLTTAQWTQEIANTLGSEMATLYDGVQSSGEHAVRFNAAPSIPAGVYRYSIVTEHGTTTGTLRLLR